MKNKKADMPTVLLVFLVLFVVTSSLYIFVIHSQKINNEIADVGIMNKVQEEKNLADFYVFETVKISVAESYKKMALDGQFVKNPSFDLKTNVFFDTLSVTLNDKFSEEFNKTFKRNFENYDFQDEHFKKLKEAVKQNKFDYEFDGEKVKVGVNGLEIKEVSEKINVIYTPKISIEISLNKMGLDSFNKIYNVKEACKNLQETTIIKECFEKNLTNFDVEVTEKQGLQGQQGSPETKSFIVTLTSKDSFLIEGEFENIKLRFIPV